MKNNFKTLIILALLMTGGLGLSQSISATNSKTEPCASCEPDGWELHSGTPDVSNNYQAAIPGSIGGGGARWRSQENNNGYDITLPNPPNGHQTWLSLRDVGNAGSEESIKTTITGLTSNREYEVVVYSLTAATGIGQSSRHYAGRYIDYYTFTVGDNPKVQVSDVSINEWGVNKLRFTASADSEVLLIEPGDNAGNVGNRWQNMETVQISVTVNAVNTAPVANDDHATTTEGSTVSINVLENDEEFDDGQNIVITSIDLDPDTPGIQTSITTADGTWTVNNGIVEFTPVPGFTGIATLTYTIQDDYTVPGSNPLTSAPATSSPATISVTVESCNAGNEQVNLNTNILNN